MVLRGDESSSSAPCVTALCQCRAVHEQREKVIVATLATAAALAALLFLPVLVIVRT